MAQNSFVCNITPEQAGELRELLESRNWEFSALPYGRYKASGDHVSVAAYNSGKLVVQGKNCADFVLYTLEPEILHTFTFGYENLSENGSAAEPVPAAAEPITH
jgi:ribonuclease HIII